MTRKVTVMATVRITVEVDTEHKSREEIAEEGYNIAKKSLVDNGWVIMQVGAFVERPEEKEEIPVASKTKSQNSLNG